MNASSTIPARRVVANICLTLDGCYRGPGGPADLAAIVPYATTDVARDHMARFVASSTTAVLGRSNAEGFLGFWPGVIEAEGADPRDVAYARWLVTTEKVVLSTTLTEAPWENARIVNAPAPDVVARLRASGSGDILVNSSVSVIKALLAADEVDRLEILLVPEVVGGEARLLEEGLPASTWSLVQHTAGEAGELSLTYDRVRWRWRRALRTGSRSFQRPCLSNGDVNSCWWASRLNRT
ncbi:dihydrofolate reductase family protein [Myceligenerans pegani]|uniref:Dihydrofolate reductase family protein n=1 Tax=Myceligenerans pegani TaxID=2776917 RepID=A0ABR9N1A4_9MICO|nr:dihydrofolate reductase family protein [Myceligenerans sp. TRM 65318]MBE1877445.1 dihydrofolate reductase family protein [Myceligenerans sp. TRM 65318]MBE3019716.1 dihydrofolate reductase family protein [Myceligenerans sp. TRM 65318]